MDDWVGVMVAGWLGMSSVLKSSAIHPMSDAARRATTQAFSMHPLRQWLHARGGTTQHWLGMLRYSIRASGCSNDGWGGWLGLGWAGWGRVGWGGVGCNE